MQFDVQNDGNVHFGLQGVKVRGMDASGQALFEKQLEGWYVLAGSPRTYSVAVPAEKCSKLKTIVIDAQTDVSSLGRAGAITTQFEVPPASCN